MSLARILGKQKGKQVYKSDPRLVLPDCPMGMEFEYEGVYDRELPQGDPADHWQYHEERSLKDNGAEYVFAVPLFGADFFNATSWLMSYAAKQKWKCTKRTGIHIHVDVRDLEVQQLAGMCMIYAAMEPILYRWIGDSRDVSHFCIPLYQSDDALEKTAEIVRMALLDYRSGGNVTSKLSGDFGRYAGFNLNALSKFGSVEFRHMQTTHDQERVFDWANMCLSLKSAAFRLPQSDASVIQLLEEMPPIEAVNYIYGETLGKKLITENLGSDFRIGLESARDIAVHGTKSGWNTFKIPTGKHEGYHKWKKAGPVKNIEDSEDEDEFIEEDDLHQIDPAIEVRTGAEFNNMFRWAGLAQPDRDRLNLPPAGQMEMPARRPIRPRR